MRFLIGSIAVRALLARAMKGVKPVTVKATIEVRFKLR